MKLTNTITESLITAVTIEMRRLIIHQRDSSDEIFAETAIADLLNYVTGRNGKDCKYLIAKDIELAIYHEFMDIVWLINNLYLYTGTDPTHQINMSAQAQFREKILANYQMAPRKITRISNQQVRDETGKLWDFGISQMKIKLSAKKINNSHDQTRLDQALCQSARAVNVSSNFKYPKAEHGIEAIYGTMTPYFTRTDRFHFTLAQSAKPSEAIRSLFAPQATPLIIECNMAMHIMEYKAVLDFLGDELFDQVFLQIGITISRSSKDNQILKCRDQINGNWQNLAPDQKSFLEELTPGDILYIRNIEPYLNRHAFGESTGHNVVYLGRNASGVQEFAGLFTIKRVRSLEEILDLLVEDYNLMPHYITESENSLECRRAVIGGLC